MTMRGLLAIFLPEVLWFQFAQGPLNFNLDRDPVGNLLLIPGLPFAQEDIYMEWQSCRREHSFYDTDERNVTGLRPELLLQLQQYKTSGATHRFCADDSGFNIWIQIAGQVRCTLDTGLGTTLHARTVCRSVHSTHTPTNSMCQ